MTTIATAAALMLSLGGACERPAEGAVTKQPDDEGVELSWSLSKDPDGGRLRIEYRLANNSDHPIYVADRLVAYHEGAVKLVPDRVIVAAGEQPDAIRFVRAMVDTRSTEYQHAPGANLVKPGAVHVGRASVPLPLRGWHNYGEPPRIPTAPARAVLEIAYLVGDAIEWGRVTTTDGAAVTVPQLSSYHRFVRLARSPALDLQLAR